MVGDQFMNERRVSVEPGTLQFQFEGRVWSYRNPGTLYFVSLPQEMSADILDLVGQSLNPWGTVPVTVTIDDFTWESAMFPRKDCQCYDVPLNARARNRLRIADDDLIVIAISIQLPA